MSIPRFCGYLFLHRDIKWVHLALLPVYDKKGLERLESILIDLAEVDETLTDNEAL